MAGIYVKVIGLAKGSQEALSLEKWTDPAYQEVVSWFTPRLVDVILIRWEIVGSRRLCVSTFVEVEERMRTDEVGF